MNPSLNSPILSGEIQGGTTAFQLPNIPCSYVKFKALSSNAGSIYLGGASVTLPDGVTDTTTGLELAPGDDSGWLPITNLNLLYAICDNNGDDLSYLILQ